MAQSNLYSTGYKCVALIQGTTYAYAKSLVLPAGKADTVKAKTNNGLQVIPDGRSDFGRVIVTVPQDAATPSANSYADTLIANAMTFTFAGYSAGLNGHVFTTTANNAYCVSDTMGTAERGRTV